jgi:hypothetical protein
MVRNNLILLRCGEASLHTAWLGGLESRTWDLVLFPYTSSTHFLQSDGVFVVGAVVGPKWHAMKELLRKWPLERHWSDYDFIWLPDDDLFITQDNLNAFFSCSKEISAKLCAPALDERSFFSYFVTMRNKYFQVRAANFVETMMPCFSSGALQVLFQTFDLERTGYAWGVDFLWSHMLDYKDIYIVDSISALHTRPVGAGRSPEQFQKCEAEMHRIVGSFKLKKSLRTTRGLQKDGVWLPDSDPVFMARLIQGWHYLIEEREYLLHYILSYQGYGRRE